MQAWALSQRLSASAQVSIHALVPKCPLTSAEMSSCRSVFGTLRSVLVPKCLGSEVSGYQSAACPVWVWGV